MEDQILKNIIEKLKSYRKTMFDPEHFNPSDDMILDCATRIYISEQIQIQQEKSKKFLNPGFQYNITNYQGNDWRGGTYPCPITGATLTNSTGTAFTATTDYVFNTNTGGFTLKNTAIVNGTTDNRTYVSFTHCDIGYSNDSTTRAIIPLIQTFAIIALIIVGVAFIRNEFDFDF